MSIQLHQVPRALSRSGILTTQSCNATCRPEWFQTRFACHITKQESCTTAKIFVFFVDSWWSWILVVYDSDFTFFWISHLWPVPSKNGVAWAVASKNVPWEVLKLSQLSCKVLTLQRGRSNFSWIASDPSSVPIIWSSVLATRCN